MTARSRQPAAREGELGADEHWMAEALAEARKASERGEVPVGAVVVLDGQAISRAHNLTDGRQDPTAHAEILALRLAAAQQRSWRLPEATLYVTLEPCLMCLGAAYLARIKRLIYGAADPKYGACGSVYDIPGPAAYPHRLEVRGGVGDEEATRLLKEFFGGLRS